MTRLLLQALHQWQLLQRWNAETQVHSAEVIAEEAQAELERAHALLAHNTRLLDDAKLRVMKSGHRIYVRERQKFLGI